MLRFYILQFEEPISKLVANVVVPYFDVFAPPLCIAVFNLFYGRLVVDRKHKRGTLVSNF